MLDSVIRLASLAVMSVVVANLRERSETCVRYGPANAIRRAQRGDGHQHEQRPISARRRVSDECASECESKIKSCTQLLR